MTDELVIGQAQEIERLQLEVIRLNSVLYLAREGKRVAEAKAEQFRAAMEPFARFGQDIKDHPRDGLGDILYSWDFRDSGIRMSDLLVAAELLRPEEPDPEPKP